MMTAKEKYDAEMKLINAYTKKGLSPQEEKDLDKETDEIMEQIKSDEEKRLDKNMGTSKISVTKEQFLANKEKQVKQDAINRIKTLQQTQRNHLTPEQRNNLNLVLTIFVKQKFKNEVLNHLSDKRIKLEKEYIEKQTETKNFHVDLMQKLNELSNDCIKMKGQIEFIDKEICELVEKNPDLLSPGGN